MNEKEMHHGRAPSAGETGIARSMSFEELVELSARVEWRLARYQEAGPAETEATDRF